MTRQRRAARDRTIRRSLPVVLFAMALVAGPQAFAQTAGAIQGKVVNGTKDGPVAGVEVTLQMFGQAQDLGARTATTDEAGTFAFTDLPNDLAGYQLAASYGGATFRNQAASYTSGQAVSETVTVYEPTNDPADVTLTDYIVWIDREGQGVAVQHDFSWTNGGTSAYVGSGDAGGSTVTVPLPDGATDLQYLGTFLENPGKVRGGTYVSDAPILPGDSSATLRYSAPPIEELTLETPFDTTSLQLFVPGDVQVSSNQLRLSGTVSEPDPTTGQTQTYSVYAADDVPAGTSLKVGMSQVTGGGSSRSTILIWLLVGLGIVIFAGLLLVIVRRRRPATPRKRSATARSGREPAKTKERAEPARASAGAEGNGKASHEEEAEDPDLIIDEIAALDLSFERGLLEERTYKRLRVAAKDRLLRAQGARAKGGRR